MRLIHRAISAKNTLIRISKIIKESTAGNPDTRASETMSDIAQIIEESSNAIEIEEIVKEVYSNPEWFKSYYEISRHPGDININKWLVEKGWALAYRKYSKDYVEEELFAKNNKLGLWQGKFLEPWKWRRRK